MLAFAVETRSEKSIPSKQTRRLQLPLDKRRTKRKWNGMKMDTQIPTTPMTNSHEEVHERHILLEKPPRKFIAT